MANERSTWGSKRPRGKNSWQLRYTVAGKPVNETFHGTEKEADRRLAELRIKYEGATEDMTLDQFWNTYYYPEIKSTLAESTVVGYVKVYDKVISPTFGDSALNEISPRMIQSWLDPMTSGKARHAKAVLSAILSRAFALDYINDNPAQRRFVMPKGEAKGQRSKAVFTMDELELVLDLSKGELWRAAYILAAFGGASREEAVSPKLDEITFNDDWAIIPIVRGIQRLHGKVVEVPTPKNKFRARDLIIPPPYSMELKKIVEDAKDAGDVWLSDDGMGNPMCPDRIADTYRRWFQNQPIKYVPFGNLRNSYGTVMESLGLDGMMVSQIMGHSQPKTFYRHYFRPSTEDKKEAISKVVDNFGQNPELSRNEKGQTSV